MESRLHLTYRYHEYIRLFKNSNFIGYKGETVEKPTKKSMVDDDFNIEIQNTSVDGSRKLLIENDDRHPGIRYLDPDTLTWLPIILTNVLEVNPCDDHYSFWWFTHDFARAYSERHGILPIALIDNLELMIRLISANPLMGTSPEARQVNEILWESKVLAAYIGYPTLEGVAKLACRRDIKMNGEIRNDRKIRRLSDDREYMYYGDGDGICSNVGMLLWHFEKEIARPEHQLLLKDMREAIGEIFNHRSDRVYGLLKDFRNDSLHGRDRARQEHGVLLNLICQIVWMILVP